MSIDYASNLSPYPNKGKCGEKEHLDTSELLSFKSKQLGDLILQAHNVVVLTGAGISTSCGIPDFRGPNGVWTLEEKGQKCKFNMTFEEAHPSFTHVALAKLEKLNKIQFLITQNVDGLHFKSGFPLNKTAEIHGNIFSRICHICRRKYIFPNASPTLGLKFTGERCADTNINNKIFLDPSSNPKIYNHKSCRGKLKDSILDWEDELPSSDLDNCHQFAKNADLFICLGTSLQIYPCANFPRIAKRRGAKLIIVNLQKTKLDKLCDIRIFGYVDEVMKIVLEKIKILENGVTSVPEL